MQNAIIMRFLTGRLLKTNYHPSASDGLCNTHSATDSQLLGFHIAAKEEKAFQNMFARQQKSARDTQGQTQHLKLLVIHILFLRR